MSLPSVPHDGTPARCGAEQSASILGIVNAAAEAYRGVIPPDRWHEPYMSAGELAAEMAAGVAFWGIWQAGLLAGVMGVQPVRDVELIRHAYVMPAFQGSGIGGTLLDHILRGKPRRLLVGTWEAAGWAIAFYERHGFARVSRTQASALLKTYWSIPDRQIATSVVLERDRTHNSLEHAA